MSAHRCRYNISIFILLKEDDTNLSAMPIKILKEGKEAVDGMVDERNKSSKKDSISYGQVLHFVYQILLLFNEGNVESSLTSG